LQDLLGRQVDLTTPKALHKALKKRILEEAVAAVENYLAGMTFEDFIQDQRTVDAVVRRFTIIGEASKSFAGRNLRPQSPHSLGGDEAHAESCRPRVLRFQ
jgi:hypothetical protein